MVWTEVVNEDAGITHVNGYQVIFPIGDVDEADVHGVMQYAQERAVWKQQLEELRQLGETIERNMRASERLDGTKYEGML